MMEAIGQNSKRPKRVDPWVYTLNRAVAQLVPLNLGYWISVPIADLFHAVWRSKRESAQRNYARILGRSVNDPLVRRMARESFRQFGRYIVELLHVQGWSMDSLWERVDLEGEEHFEEARAFGRGVIFTSAHMGSMEVASSLVLLKGYKITSVAEWLRPKVLMDWIVTCRAKMGITLYPSTGSGMKLLRALRRNEMVALVVDIGVANGGGVPVTFFGHRTLFPVGPARLARLSGAPIIFGLAARRRDGRFVAHVGPPMFSNGELDPEEDIRRLTQRIVDEFEGFVRRYPEQWYAFRDMWPNDGWPLLEC